MNEFNVNKIKDKISICALAYNHFNYLDDFFKGVLNQQLENYHTEIIIGVDKCNDMTLEKCLEYKSKFPELIKLIIHPDRVGMMQNFVSVLENADGEYIAFCECDDYWIDEYKLLEQINILIQNNDSGLCFTDIKILKSNDSFFTDNWATIKKNKYTIEDIIEFNVITTCSVVMKNNLDSILINQLMKFEVGDWPLYILSMLKDNTNAIYSDKVTAVYRQHDGGIHSTKNTLQRLVITTSVYKSMMDIIILKRTKQLLTKALSKNYYSMGVFETDQTNARSNYVLSIMKLNYFNFKFPIFSALRYLLSFAGN